MEENIKYIIWSTIETVVRIIISLGIIAISLNYVPIWVSYLIGLLFLWWISQMLRSIHWHYEEYKLKKKRKR